MRVSEVGKVLEAAGHSGATSQVPTATATPTNVDRVASQEPAAGMPVRKDQPLTIQVFTFDLPKVL